MAVWTFGSGENNWTGITGVTCGAGGITVRNAGSICGQSGHWFASPCLAAGVLWQEVRMESDNALSFDDITLYFEAQNGDYGGPWGANIAIVLKQSSSAGGPWTTINTLGFSSDGCQSLKFTSTQASKYIQINLTIAGDAVTAPTAKLYKIEATGAELRLIDMAADESKLYVTANEGESLGLKVYDLNTFTGDEVTVTEGANLGPITYAQLDAGTYDAKVVTLPNKEGGLIVYGRNWDDDPILESVDFGATLVDIGDKSVFPLWGASKVARACLIRYFGNTGDYVLLFNDDDIYRTTEGSNVWVKTGNGVEAAYGVAARGAVNYVDILIAGTGAGTIDFTNNYGGTFYDTGDGSIGVVNAIEAVQSGSG